MKLHKHQHLELIIDWAGQKVVFPYWFQAVNAGYKGALKPIRGMPLPRNQVVAKDLGELEMYLERLVLEVMER